MANYTQVYINFNNIADSMVTNISSTPSDTIKYYCLHLYKINTLQRFYLAQTMVQIYWCNFMNMKNL